MFLSFPTTTVLLVTIYTLSFVCIKTQEKLIPQCSRPSSLLTKIIIWILILWEKKTWLNAYYSNAYTLSFVLFTYSVFPLTFFMFSTYYTTTTCLSYALWNKQVIIMIITYRNRLLYQSMFLYCLQKLRESCMHHLYTHWYHCYFYIIIRTSKKFFRLGFCS